jgi:hypothetical protein
LILLEHEGFVSGKEMRAIRAEVIVEPFETKAKLGSDFVLHATANDVTCISVAVAEA